MASNQAVKFCPAQQRVFDALQHGLKVGTIFRLWGSTGKGKTTLLRHLSDQLDSVYVDVKDIVANAGQRHPFSVEDLVHERVAAALESHPAVILDDVDLLDFGHCAHFYPRRGYFDSMVAALCNIALERDRKLIFGTTGHLGDSGEERGYSFGIPRFKVEDYASLVEAWQGREVADGLDFEKIFRFAPKLNAHQLKSACTWLANGHRFTTDTFVEYLRSSARSDSIGARRAVAGDETSR